MRRQYFVILVAFVLSPPSFAHSQFTLPLEGKQGIDWFLVNYVDHDTAVGSYRDFKCNPETYDQHWGSDFVLRDFRQMDSGVYVTAAKAGIVYFTKDSLFDRSKQTDTGGYGNFISINHGDSLFTLYAHLKKYSQLVKVGDSVKQGQRIAMVGSSGKAADPHVHMELYYQGFLYDPFGEDCPGTFHTWWNATPPYDDSFIVITQGLSANTGTLDSLQAIDSLREHPSDETPTQIVNDSFLTFWAHGLSVHKGDSMRVDWHAPDASLWFTYTYRWQQYQRYWYWWSYIDGPTRITMSPGVWSADLYLNGKEVSSYHFTIEASNVASDRPPTELLTPFPEPASDHISLQTNSIADVRMYNVIGRESACHFSKQSEGVRVDWQNDLPNGTYILALKYPNATTQEVRILVQH